MLAALSLTLTLSGPSCSGDDGGATPPAQNPPLTYAQFIDDYAPKVALIRCRQTLECYDQYDAIPLFRHFSNHPSLEACSQDVLTGRLQVFRVTDPLAAQGLEAGRRSFDPEKAQTCLAEIDPVTTMDCPALLKRITSLGEDNPTSPCAQVLGPLVKEGDACQTDAECEPVSGKKIACLGLTCPGHQGGLCQAEEMPPCNRTCSAGEYCDEDVNSCRPRAPLGASCPNDEACTSPAVCSSFLGICITPKSQAQKSRCTDSIECAAGLRCAPTDQEGVSTCAPFAFQQEGDACTDTFDFDPGPCARGLKCLLSGEDDMGTCAPLSAQGGPCQQTYHCTPGLACVGAEEGSDGSCTTPLPDGSPCNVAAFDSFQCQSINCDFDTATCQPSDLECSES